MANRGNFTGKLGFILAATGSAIGLSNIWRFPYLAGQNGGAVFLIIYLACIFLFCFPVMIGEIAIGRAATSDAYGAYTKLGNKRWGWVGLGGVISGILILSYYNVVAGWTLGYFIEVCFNNLLQQPDYKSHFFSFISKASTNIACAFIFLFITAFAVSRGIHHGIERANRILMPALLVILIGLIAYSLMLPGAMQGVKFYLIPDFSKVNAQTIYDALRLSFFTLSLGIGGLMTYGSYVSKTDNLIYASSIITWADTIIAFLAGLMIFPLVFSAGVSPAEGPALVFIVMPEIFHNMGPVIGKVVGSAFFLLLAFAALPSCISLLELPAAYFIDQKKLPRQVVVWLLAIVIFLLGIPTILSQGASETFTKLSFYKNKDFLTFIADITDVSLTVGGCLMCLFIAHRWKIAKLDQELKQGNEHYMKSVTRKYINFSIVYVCPVMLGILSVLILIDKILS
ncbi:sodium-dependent transporter [Pseudochryseolinea flava]|uniref:Transporter n=1 Tax=Pseudochryseolinea flava TaxID=2059302 RepID=A0A364Y3Z6_9BACT|nr:sodium-dependent transporter [Pseudochryseolinea flava]RAW01449.1 sodium-dependent transporter [Pseudochryseolinea flava]